ncbi:MAG TPA: tetratricopeptide repeat protein [Sphingomicrobium sp.]|nr:tetratricopeptide repeat protein [Sphingomicrobium sp.]
MASLGLSEADRGAIQRFDADVIQPSKASLVVLQFTAEWCGPCKQLSPILDKVANDYAAKGVKLVRIDVDKEKMIAAQFRIQSIPTVYAFYQGQPVADLTSYRSEGQIGRVLDQLLAQLQVSGEGAALEAEIEPLIAMGEEILAGGDPARAESIFRQILDMAPDNPEVIGGLARALVAGGRNDDARAVLDAAPDSAAKAPPVARARAALDLASAAPAGATAELEARVQGNPDDHDARLELAAALIAAGERDRAADVLLESIARDKDWNEGAARKRLLQLIEAQGLDDPWGRAQRRRLSALLFT